MRFDAAYLALGFFFYWIITSEAQQEFPARWLYIIISASKWDEATSRTGVCVLNTACVIKRFGVSFESRKQIAAWLCMHEKKSLVAVVVNWGLFVKVEIRCKNTASLLVSLSDNKRQILVMQKSKTKQSKTFTSLCSSEGFNLVFFSYQIRWTESNFNKSPVCNPEVSLRFIHLCSSAHTAVAKGVRSLLSVGSAALHPRQSLIGKKIVDLWSLNYM